MPRSLRTDRSQGPLLGASRPRLWGPLGAVGVLGSLEPLAALEGGRSPQGLAGGRTQGSWCGGGETPIFHYHAYLAQVWPSAGTLDIIR